MSDEFDSIINNQPEDPNGGAELKHIWDAVESLWPQFYPGTMLIKGVLLAECIDEDGDRCLRFIASPDMMPWDMVGMLDSGMQDARNMGRYVVLDGDEDEGDEE
jgi:hypothetical protein